MKKIILGGLGILLILLSSMRFLAIKSQITNDKSQTNSKIQITKPAREVASRRSLFVPYWSNGLDEKDLSYDSFYYFGIRPTREGKIDSDEGFKQLPLVQSVKNRELVLRMLDASITEVLLEDKRVQNILVSEVKNIISKNEFSGLVLDIEVPFTLRANKEKQITEFVQQMCTDIKIDYKSCSMLVYGDFSYRKRPYDLKNLGRYVDKILLMAYDFHKAGGEPGPNFPLDRRSTKSEGGFDYGYSFKQMIADTTALVPKEKIEVVFGMYGYDWTLNEQGTPLKGAKALTLNELKLITQNLQLTTQNQNKSQVKSFKLKMNAALEKSIQYTDSDGRSHIIWYEDEESVAVKTKYLQSQGVNKISYWAQGYY